MKKRRSEDQIGSGGGVGGGGGREAHATSGSIHNNSFMFYQLPNALVQQCANVFASSPRPVSLHLLDRSHLLDRGVDAAM